MTDSIEPRYLPTLRRRGHALASTDEQNRLLAAAELRQSFGDAVAASGQGPLTAAGVDVLQVNVGKKCNQACRHCHVDAGPDRKEEMSDAVLDACLEVVESGRVKTLDITGGAPELHPRFRELVERARGAGLDVMDRCNLTILQVPKHRDLVEFFVRQRVQVVASLPWYSEGRTDAQRGDGVFDQSIAALVRLNESGYGMDGSGLVLNLVTNPVGSYLFDDPSALEAHYKHEMWRRHRVRFNRLFTMTNMPVSRFLEHLVERGQLQAYLEKLLASFNPSAVRGLMCRTTLSVGYDGRLYDCDFNQMLDLSLPRTIFDFSMADLAGRPIRTGPHCFGCTAGRGSSCGGAIV